MAPGHHGHIRHKDKWLWNNMSDAQLLQIAEYAEQMEKFEDMRQAMKHYLERRKSLSLEERNLFVDAYKTLATGLRGQWRIAVSLFHTQNADTMAEVSVNADGKKVSFDLREHFSRLFQNVLVSSD